MKQSYDYWIKRWQDSKSFCVENDRFKPKSYILTEFPKTSTFGFQNGDIRIPLIGDVFSRYQRMAGYNVMYPIGYDSLGLKSFLENKKMSNILNDDIATLFKEQLLKLGVGIDESKEIDLKHNEYLTILQLAFIDLYERGYIKYDNIIVYQDEQQKKIIDSYYKNDNLSPNRVKAFYLDISECTDLIVNRINALNVDKNVKEELLNMLEPKRSIEVDFLLTNGKRITAELKNPEYMGGISFISLHPDYIDIEEFISLDELGALELYLSEHNSNDFGLFTGYYATNPLTGNKIPVFISVNYDEPVHIAIPCINKADYDCALAEGIRVLDVVQDGVFIQSDFLNGVDVSLAKDLLIDNFIKADMCNVNYYYDKKNILVSSLDTLGALIPFLKDSDNQIYSLKKHLPFIFSPQYRPILGSDVDVPGRTIEGSINHIFSSGMVPVLSLIYDEIGGSSSIFSADLIRIFNEWDGIQTYILNSSQLFVEVFIPCVIMAIIEKEKGVKLPPLFKELLIVQPIFDSKGSMIERSNNNLLDFNKLLKEYSADAIRLYFLSNNYESFNFNKILLNEYQLLVEEIEEFFYKGFANSNSLGPKFKEFASNVTEQLNSKNIYEYSKIVVDFYNNVIKESKITSKQALLFLKSIYPLMPFMADDIYKEVFKGKYLISDDGWF